MKEFFRALLYVLITQIACWGIFILCDEFPLLSQSSAESLALVVGLIFSIIILVLYLVVVKKIIKKYELNSKRFNIFLILLWIVISILSLMSFLWLVEEELLHVCKSSGWDCFLNGIEYGIYGLLLVIVAIVVIIVKILSAIYRVIRNNLSKRDY